MWRANQSSTQSRDRGEPINGQPNHVIASSHLAPSGSFLCPWSTQLNAFYVQSEILFLKTICNISTSSLPPPLVKSICCTCLFVLFVCISEFCLFDFLSRLLMILSSLFADYWLRCVYFHVWWRYFPPDMCHKQDIVSN